MLKKRVEGLEQEIKQVKEFMDAQLKNQNTFMKTLTTSLVEERVKKELEAIKTKVAELEKLVKGLETKISSKDLEQLRKLAEELIAPVGTVMAGPLPGAVAMLSAKKETEKKKKKRKR
uniref:Uncharacterized protein n=1 Tax=viral metagenome TaxID=1070528 RepID=A0A6M3K4C1_9ZZZZ